MTKLAQLIAKEEGFFKSGSLPQRRKNPGDLKHSPHSQHPGGAGHENDVGTIDTVSHGWEDLERQLQIDAGRGLTLRQAIYSWAPASDGNNPTRYLADVVAGFHSPAVTPDTPLKQVLLIQA